MGVVPLAESFPQEEPTLKTIHPHQALGDMSQFLDLVSRNCAAFLIPKVNVTCTKCLKLNSTEGSYSELILIHLHKLGIGP